MKKKILIINGDRKTVDSFSGCLTSDYEIFCVYNAKDGLETLKNYTVDLIILDLKIPGMSGERFLKLVKENPDMKNIKVMILSSMKRAINIEEFESSEKKSIIKSELQVYGYAETDIMFSGRSSLGIMDKVNELMAEV